LSTVATLRLCCAQDVIGTRSGSSAAGVDHCLSELCVSHPSTKGKCSEPPRDARQFSAGDGRCATY
jgi:hypothetical protein